MSFILCGQCGQQNSVTARYCSNCDADLPGMRSDRADPLVPGTYLHNGRYLIADVLSTGNLGGIYQAEDTNNEHQAIALREFIPPIAKPAVLDKIVQLLNSATRARSHVEHSQVAQFWHVFAEDCRIFLVGDLVEGTSYRFLLQQRKRQGRCFSEAEIIQLWRQVLPIFNELHDRGAIHGYIYPGTILHSKNDRLPILTDYGGIHELAIQLMSPSKFSVNIEGRWGTILKGKPGYAPEEQLRQGIVTPKSDLYALAVTSLVLMTGKPPEKLIDVFTMSWSWHRDLNLTPFLNDCLLKMLAREPGSRFESAAEVLDAIASNPDLPLPIVEADDPITENPPPPNDSPRENPDDPITENGPVSHDLVPPLKRGVRGDNPRETTDLESEDAQRVSIKPSDEFLTQNPELNRSSLIIPKEVMGWNWGAAILPGFWCLTNHVWFGLFAWFGFFLNPVAGLFTWCLVGLILGMQGNELSWKSRNWRSLADFKFHQKGWGLFVGINSIILLAGILLLIVAIFMG